MASPPAWAWAVALAAIASRKANPDRHRAIHSNDNSVRLRMDIMFPPNMATRGSPLPHGNLRHSVSEQHCGRYANSCMPERYRHCCPDLMAPQPRQHYSPTSNATANARRLDYDNASPPRFRRNGPRLRFVAPRLLSTAAAVGGFALS